MKKINHFLLGISFTTFALKAIAATPIDLKHQATSVLNHFSKSSQVTFKELRREKDQNQTMHVRLQQMYAGFPVYGADFIIHTPKNGPTFMNGVIYQDLNLDLKNPPVIQSEKILNHTMQKFHYEKNKVRDGKAELIIYVDSKNQAHWAYHVSFFVESKDIPKKPNFIIDTFSEQVYQAWNDIHTLVNPADQVREENDTSEKVSPQQVSHKTSDSDAFAEGFGGNLKIGKYLFDGVKLPFLTVERDEVTSQCFFINKNLKVMNQYATKTMSFPCKPSNCDQANVCYDGSFDEVNGAYSPSNDAMYAATAVQNMYQNWYGILPVADHNEDPVNITLNVHLNYANAEWTLKDFYFGDGDSTYYPFVSLGIMGWEFGKSFTEVYSGLIYMGESGGVSESFAHMAAQAAEYYATGKNSWKIGAEIKKQPGDALYWMDLPSTDCKGKKPGNLCSVDKMSQYYNGLDPHFSAGVFNRAFYLIGSEYGWNDTKKAFDIMVQANRFYWTYDTSFNEAACGVLKATEDLGYDTTVVKKAFYTVEVNYSHC